MNKLIDNPKILELYVEYHNIFIKKASRFLKDNKLYNNKILIEDLEDFKHNIGHAPHIIFSFEIKEKEENKFILYDNFCDFILNDYIEYINKLLNLTCLENNVDNENLLKSIKNRCLFSYLQSNMTYFYSVGFDLLIKFKVIINKNDICTKNRS